MIVSTDLIRLGRIDDNHAGQPLCSNVRSRALKHFLTIESIVVSVAHVTRARS
jgi:hypothetical protein